MAMEFLKKREIPLLITSLSVAVMLIGYFLSISFLKDVSSLLNRAVMIIGGTATIIGIINVTMLYVRRINQRQEGHWYFAIYGLIMIAITCFLGFSYGPSSEIYIKYFQTIIVPLYSAMTGLLIFFITTATYRAFRARTLEGTLLLVSGCLVLLGNAPFGELISPVFPQISKWILDVPNGAAARGMTIGSGIGFVALGLRIMLGRERAAVPGGGE